MDSDDDFEVNLPKINDDPGSQGKIDLQKLIDGGCEEVDFDMPDSLKTEGFKKPDVKAKFLHPATQRQMELKFLQFPMDEAAAVMFGDYSEIEQLMTNVTDDGKVKKLVLRPGTGAKVTRGSTVRIHFLFGAETMDDIIESTYEYGRLKKYRVGAEEVLPGMDIGLSTMRVGEVSKILCASEYGFRDQDVPISDDAVIPADSRLMMQIEVFEVSQVKRDESISTMSTAERQATSFQELFIYTEEIKQEGNRYFRDGDYDLATTNYSEALDALADMRPVTPEERNNYFRLRSQICTNLAQVYFKRGKFKRCLGCAKSGTEVPVSGVLKGKSHFWCAKALFELGRYDECYSQIMKTLNASGSEPPVEELKKAVQKKLIEAKENEKVICARMMAASLSDKTDNSKN